VSPDTDFGVIFLHNEGYSSMCGHGIIGLTKVVIETGMFKMNHPVTSIKIDTPSGQIISYAKIKNNKVESVYFHNVPSYIYSQDNIIHISDIGKVKYDIAFGGAFYAFVDADELGISLNKDNQVELIQKGMAIKRTIMNNQSIVHPFENDLGFLYGTIFTGKSSDKNIHSRHVCIFAEGEVDRSPTGTGVSARMALLYEKHEIDVNKAISIESIIGTTFKGSVYQTTKYGGYNAVIPEVEGKAYITGKHEFVIDPYDTINKGFILR
jgi:trans-L-3-hydroxyproline dehydratase